MHRPNLCRTYLLMFTALLLCGAALPCAAETSVTRHGITWTFEGDPETGQFLGGDPWVVGPVVVTGISTTLHDKGFEPAIDDDGSMLNPGTDSRQGYDGSVKSYDASLNAGLVGGKRVSADNPLRIKPGSSLVSMVSWLYRSPEDAEEGIPNFNRGTKAPRPVTRTGAVLTVLAEPPPEDSFRPAYSGGDYKSLHQLADVDFSRLQSLPVPPNAPDLAQLAADLEHPWIDHVNEYLGAMVHPSANMPNYGREIAKTIAAATLATHLEYKSERDRELQREITLRLIQMGIDFGGIADAGGGWPANGGHHLGRKLPILYAGALLNDEHLLGAGEWDTRFQEDEQTFIVSEADVQLTNSGKWAPDSRAKDQEPYEPKDIGTPDWGIRHATKPFSDNRGWNTPYREVNGASIPSLALAACLTGLREAWDHEPFFLYASRYMEVIRSDGQPLKGVNVPEPFPVDLWDRHAEGVGL